jgi:hypothetical protein
VFTCKRCGEVGVIIDSLPAMKMGWDSNRAGRGEQIGSDTYRYLKNPERFKGPRRTAGVEGLRAWDDVPDRVSIMIGMKLYEHYPNGGVTAKIVMNEVLALGAKDWGTGIRDHKCKP